MDRKGTISQNGCSMCAAGQENYTTFTAIICRKNVKRMQYDYRTPEGELFSCVGKDLEDCRRKRNEWLKSLTLKEVKIEDLANICPECEFRICRDSKFVNRLLVSRIPNAKRDGYYETDGGIRIAPLVIDVNDKVFISKEDYNKYFNK